MLPEARRDRLLVQQVGRELVVYDQDRHRAHRLNESAAVVWRHCDGTMSVAEIAGLLRDELHLPASEELVRLTVMRLERARLLEGPIPAAYRAPVSRRRVIARLGRAGALALLPVVATLVAPTPGMTQTVTDRRSCVRRCGGRCVFFLECIRAVRDCAGCINTDDCACDPPNVCCFHP